MGLTRDEQELDLIYVCPDGTAFFTPDGLGRIWFDSQEEAQEETGIEDVHFLHEHPEDF